MGSPAYWGQLVSFMAGLRKPALIPFGLFSPDDNLGFIASVSNTVGYAVEAPLGIVTVAGSTFNFTFPPSYLVVNGSTLFPPGDFTIVGTLATLPWPLSVGDKIYGVSV